MTAHVIRFPARDGLARLQDTREQRAIRRSQVPYAPPVRTSPRWLVVAAVLAACAVLVLVG